jgi:hypothetical protein
MKLHYLRLSASGCHLWRACRVIQHNLNRSPLDTRGSYCWMLETHKKCFHWYATFVQCVSHIDGPVCKLWIQFALKLHGKEKRPQADLHGVKQMYFEINPRTWCSGRGTQFVTIRGRVGPDRNRGSKIHLSIVAWNGWLIRRGNSTVVTWDHSQLIRNES